MNKGTVTAVAIGALAVLGLIVAALGDGDGPDVAAAVSALTGQDDDERSGDDAIGPEVTAPEVTAPEVTAAESAAAEVPPFLGPVPSLVPVDGWLQTQATTFDDFAGTVRIVQFWTFTCFNCKNTIPHLQEIYAEAHPRGLEIIGVHAPEFEREEDPAAVAQAAVDLGVTWPIALDTDKALFRSWQGSRRFWPRTYVIDQNGQIRFDHIGEGDYDELAATVDWLLEHGPGEPPVDSATADPAASDDAGGSAAD